MNTKQPHIETLQMTIGVAMAEEDSPQNIEIPLEIKLPNGRTMYPACVLGGLPFHGQQQIAERIAAAWNAFTGIATTEIHAHAPGAGGVEPLRKRECLHQIAEPAPLNKATAEHALRRILHIVQRYLPPDGIAIDKAMNEIIAVVDPWPVADGDSGMYPPLPRATLFSTIVDDGFAIGNAGVYTPDQMRSYADAARAASCSFSAPHGWKLVPVEPTDEMRAVGIEDEGCTVTDGRKFCTDVYEAMLAAAPQPPVAEQPAAQDAEQRAFEDWLARTYPSGDVESVQRQWEESSDYADLHEPTKAQAAAQDALEEAASVLNSINKEASHEVQVGDEVCYWQRKEWIDWAEKEVLPKVRAAIAAAQRAAAQKDE